MTCTIYNHTLHDKHTFYRAHLTVQAYDVANANA